MHSAYSPHHCAQLLSDVGAWSASNTTQHSMISFLEVISFAQHTYVAVQNGLNSLTALSAI